MGIDPLAELEMRETERSAPPRTVQQLYTVTKHYPHNLGLSACFRQWRAKSHCQYLHGYALAFTFKFAATTLDKNNWVLDFGGLKPLKQELVETFDHQLLVASDDPELDTITGLTGLGIAQTLVVDNVGCESFAEMAFRMAEQCLKDSGEYARVRVVSCTCHEHEGNSATFAELEHKV